MTCHMYQKSAINIKEILFDKGEWKKKCRLAHTERKNPKY